MLRRRSLRVGGRRKNFSGVEDWVGFLRIFFSYEVGVLFMGYWTWIFCREGGRTLDDLLEASPRLEGESASSN